MFNSFDEIFDWRKLARRPPRKYIRASIAGASGLDGLKVRVELGVKATTTSHIMSHILPENSLCNRCGLYGSSLRDMAFCWLFDTKQT